MCSLSYIPRTKGFTLSHNRDELPYRKSSSELIRKEIDDREIVFPQDLRAGGTWMGADSKGLVACILNGGSKPYLRKLPYRASRGTVIPDLLQIGNIPEFQKNWLSEGIEPFTLIAAHKNELWEFIHNPVEDSWRKLNPEIPHFWSSTKLYHPAIRKARETRFKKWYKQIHHLSSNKIAEFHLSKQINELEGGLVLPEGFPLKTISFCQFEEDENRTSFLYQYLLTGQSDRQKW